MGPMVWELDGPMPNLKRSKALTFVTDLKGWVHRVGALSANGARNLESGRLPAESFFQLAPEQNNICLFYGHSGPSQARILS